ncbi:MAG TPA: trigger factor [Thermoleophilaceae bacterium]|nr:trigger factor [Thermoleophilaceae bacterium]
MSALKTTTTELGDSRLRVDVEVDPEAVEREVADAAGAIGRDLKIPGFRKGKVPPQVVVRQIGRGAVLEEAVRRGLGEWYEQAVREAGIAPVGDPKLDVAELPEKGAPLAFNFEVGVRPRAELGDWRGIQVERPEPAATDEEVQAELDRMRESLASLETVERVAARGDFAVIDFVGSVGGEPFEGGEARGFLLELGSGRLIEGFEEQLEGASAGDERTVEVTFPDDYQAEHLAGKDASFAVTVKEVKEKRLPELDDELAVEAGGFDSLDELRDDIATKIREAKESSLEREFREAAVDAVAAAATIDIPHDLVHAKAHDMWHQTTHRLQQQGLDPAQYLQLVNKTSEELIVESEPDAERALRREAALAAIVETEGIEVGDDELLEVLREASTEPGKQPPSDKALQRSLKKARARGGDVALREDIAMRKAVDLIVEAVEPVPAALPTD